MLIGIIEKECQNCLCNSSTSFFHLSNIERSINILTIKFIICEYVFIRLVISTMLKRQIKEFLEI